MTTTLDLTAASEAIHTARRDVARLKALYYAHLATYDDMADAAKRVSNLMYDYARAKYPHIRHRRIPYQAILR